MARYWNCWVPKLVDYGPVEENHLDFAGAILNTITSSVSCRLFLANSV